MEHIGYKVCYKAAFDLQADKNSRGDILNIRALCGQKHRFRRPDLCFSSENPPEKEKNIWTEI